MERHIILAAKFKLEGEACKLRGNWYAAVGWACRIAPSSGLRPPSPPQGKRACSRKRTQNHSGSALPFGGSVATFVTRPKYWRPCRGCFQPPKIYRRHIGNWHPRRQSNLFGRRSIAIQPLLNFLFDAGRWKIWE